MPVNKKTKQMQPPKNQAFSGGISIEMNVGRMKNGLHRRKYGRFQNGEELAMFFEENSNDYKERELVK